MDRARTGLVALLTTPLDESRMREAICETIDEAGYELTGRA
ncbi:hypothetical protein [Streptomyces sp. SAI-090]|jgi:hypothetical protein|nr:hypothetical protein [Streptomyces sp. SAI-090]MDH6522249.1 hypothetical protein [Streptomyces sp. SAI-090]